MCAHTRDELLVWWTFKPFFYPGDLRTCPVSTGCRFKLEMWCITLERVTSSCCEGRERKDETRWGFVWVMTWSAASACRHVTFCHHNKDGWRDIRSSNTGVKWFSCDVITLLFLFFWTTISCTRNSNMWHLFYYFLNHKTHQHLWVRFHYVRFEDREEESRVFSCSLTLMCCSVFQIVIMTSEQTDRKLKERSSLTSLSHIR